MALGNNRTRTVIIFGIAIILLIAASYIPGGIKIFGYQIKSVDMFIDIKPDSLLGYSGNSLSDPIKVSNDSNTKFAGVISSGLIDVILEKINSSDKGTEKNSDKPAVPPASGILTRDVPITGNTSQMSYFYQALKNAGSRQLRIAHYGDSEIEGDLITSDIRDNFQRKFGGEGVGYLSITSQDITFRTTTKMSFSNNWKTTNVLSGYLGTGNPNNLPIGMSGFMATPQGVSWVRYEETGKYPSMTTFKVAKVFYTNAKPSTIKYSFNDGSEQTASLTPGKGVKELKLTYSSGATTFKLTTTMANQADFYGVSLEDGNGVYVDNFPWRGNTGISFRELNEGALRDFDRLCNYKLIIINFGGNQVSSGDSNFDWFESQMIKIINNLKSTFPQSSFLLISVGDKSKKVGTRLMTDPLVLKLVETQKRIANATGIAFWNLFEAMGGHNSMLNWVDANPPLAIKDYTHINLQGAKKIADMLTKALLDGSYNYK